MALEARKIDDIELTPIAAAREIMRRRQMRESLVGFAQRIEIPGTPLSATDETLFEPIGSRIAKHHYLLMNACQETMTTDYGRLMVFMPPGSAKSTYCTVVAPVWFMGNVPGSEIILASHNVELAKRHGSRGRIIVQQPVYIGAFGTTIEKGSTAKENWKLTNGSEYKSFGMIAGATGNRADGLVIDDPVRGRADALSPTVRDKTRDAFRDDLLTRLKPRAWIIIVQTRWDYDDLAGGILPADWNGESGPILCRDGMVWNVICIPAKNTFPDIDDPLDRPLGPVDPAENEEGEKGLAPYLWSEWFDKKHWSQFEPKPGDVNSPNEKSWWSLFQQRPRPEGGNQFEYDWFNWYDRGKEPKYLMLMSASDYALTDEYEEGTQPNFTEHGIGGIDENGDFWLIDWWYGRNTPDITIDALLTLAKRHGVRNGFGETGLIQKAMEPQFKMRQRKRSWYMNIKYLPTIGDKVARIQSFRGMCSSGQVHLPRTPWAERLVSHLCDFPSSRSPDDGPDVCALFGRATEKMIWSREKITKAQRKGVEFGSWEWLTMSSEDEPPE